jgi:1-acyl-sn-glycerol-3-phosphate acyltransferase
VCERRHVELTYPATIAAGRVLFGGLGLRITVEGDEQVPTTGPVVIASNHVSFLDFMLVGLAARRSRRYVRFLARHDVWRSPFVGRAMDAMRHVPVDPAAPAAAYLRARALLRAGEAVGVFPEAGVSTSYTVRAMMPGAVALAAETGAPLLPMTIWGPQRIATANHRWDLHRGRPVTIKLGRPYVVAPGADVRAETRRLGCALQRLLDDLQTRHAHRPPPGETAWWQPAHLGGGAPTAQEARLVETTVPRAAIAPTWQPRPRR